MSAPPEASTIQHAPFHAHVLLFAILRDTLKRDEIEVEIPAGQENPSTVAYLLAACASQFPTIAPWMPHVRVAVNCEYADAETVIAEGDEIAFIPPVAGG